MNFQDNRLATNARVADPRLFLRDEELDRALNLLLNTNFVLSETSMLAQTKSGLDRNSFTLLLLLRSTPRIGVTDARKILGLTQPTFARLMAKLEKNSLISKISGKKDGRKRLLSLSKQGEAVIAPATQAMRDAIRRAWRSVGPETVAGTMTALEALQR